MDLVFGNIVVLQWVVALLNCERKEFCEYYLVEFRTTLKFGSKLQSNQRFHVISYKISDGICLLWTSKFIISNLSPAAKGK